MKTSGAGWLQGSIGPVVKFQRELAARNHGEQWQPVELASALFVPALADTDHRAKLLQEAAAILDNASPALRSLHGVRRWHNSIRDAQHASVAITRPALQVRGAG